MAISDESLNEFIDLYATEFGERLTHAEAQPIATNLVNFYRLVMQPLPQEPHPESILARRQKEASRRRYRPRA